MKKEELFAPIREKYAALKTALERTDLEKIKKLTLEVHAMVHPAEISGRTEKTIADYVLDYMLSGYWYTGGRLTRGGMILTPMTDHHMMHLPPCLNHLPILESENS